MFHLANDDNIKVYRNGVEFSDIVCWQLNNGGVIQLGWHGSQGIDCKVQRVDVIRTEYNKAGGYNRAVLNCVGNHQKQDNGGLGHIAAFKNFLIEDVRTDTPVPFVVDVSPDSYSPYVIENIELRNWDIKYDKKRFPEETNDFFGISPETSIKGIVLNNVKFNGVRITENNWQTDGNIVLKNCEPIIFK